MERVYYNKLVRDKIPDKIKNNGEDYAVREITDPTEFEQELLKKIKEEADGLARASNRKEFLAEYADLMVVLDALTQFYEISPAELKVAMTENLDKKGFFKQRYFLHWSAAGQYQSNETPQGFNS